VLRDIKDIEGFAIHATDGVLGVVKDFYFDDELWVVRYFVVATGTQLANRRTLVSPMAMGIPNWIDKIIPASLTAAQVSGGPDIDTDRPVSRQHEIGYMGYYGYPNYWGGGGLWGAGMYPDVLQAGRDVAIASRGNEPRRRLPGQSQSNSREARPDDVHAQCQRGHALLCTCDGRGHRACRGHIGGREKLGNPLRHRQYEQLVAGA